MNTQTMELSNHEWAEVAAALEDEGGESADLAAKLYAAMEDDGAATMAITLTRSEQELVAEMLLAMDVAAELGLRLGRA